ncbi:3-dehydroquinate synthase [Aurantimonas sp. C2-6-R+9]|uniref:3-dehydroquinate synthase n=1 Tax=unclassified Aurantimonas TaxID=2638230 RepID=UPI002E18F03C|nr:MULTISPECIES: 3-dehydroquinate synthase [unclassified Aurantimonas]MEC5291447.1 3-dehydroquinate synthase [Aurantimonas sp. C2-3-R2]MEC5324242.1 3-dehydroquinate synthase [Aurantimonas sp. A3-2-R12]MEC5381711.1 3-dehydroquinate synthase [Aurantimonas sp. C2-6-R+9]MEC5412535.1 3-dehydroquinate synthase [Aurantimonas sp. C2-4-R8]
MKREAAYQADNDATAHRRVVVDLGTRSYDILIGPGLIDAAGEEIARRLPGIRAAVVTDETVAGLHLERLSIALRAAGIDHSTIVLPAGETTKSFAHLTRVVDEVLAQRLERDDAVIALGGGVIGDLAGFASAIVRRGMRFVQVPTTLLAQVDSSVGGKTGINSPHGKNLVGAFHQPSLVLADTALLDTLSPREFAAGYAELIKYGLIDRPEFFDWLDRHREAVFAGGPERADAIRQSCEAKAAVVAADEREDGSRALLNLGHTFGHALEAAVGYDSSRLVHGEGVAIGMTLAYRFSAELGLCPAEAAERCEAHLQAAGLPTRIGAIPGTPLTTAQLMAGIAQDKKVKRGRLTFILTRGIGQAFVESAVAPAAVEAFLDRENAR